MSEIPVGLLMAVSGALGGLASMFAMPLQYRRYIVRTALEAIESQQGRSAILAIAAEKQLRIEDKLDGLASSVGSMTSRVESRIDTMQSTIQQQIAKLDAETRQLEMRLVRIEQNGGRH
jgi:hypothetical protein